MNFVTKVLNAGGRIAPLIIDDLVYKGTGLFNPSVYLDKDKLLVTSAIDNLLKGASGQAVQNMNIIFGLEETTGLKLKGIGF